MRAGTKLLRRREQRPAHVPVLEWVEHKSQPEPNTGCWLSELGGTPAGYTYILVPGRGRMFAHRAVYLLTTGEDPGDGVVMHTCDQPACVNPAHLRLGTTRQNHDDCTRKGRRHQCLSEDAVRNVRALYASGHRVAAIARAHNCRPSVVSHIVHGRTRKLVGNG